MKNKVAIIVPYFGALPNYFSLWLQSAIYNKEFDFLIYTDSNDEILFKPYQNIVVNKMKFLEFGNKFRKLFEFQISLESPYKLCDYKPAYGVALKEDLQGYSFWGYCDIDLIFGNLKDFISDDILDENDRIYNLGHLTLYRNVEKMNNLYRVVHGFRDCYSYKYSYRTAFPTAYDEIGTKYGYGLSTICKRIGVKNYLSLDFADVLPDKYRFELAYTNGRHIDYFVYDHGKLYGVCKKEKKEYAYVHLQKRLMTSDQLDENIYYISPTHFRTSMEAAIKDNSSLPDKKEFDEKVRARKIMSKIQKLKQGAPIHYINKCLGRINVK